MVDEIIKSMQSKMDKTVDALKKDFGTIRTGKANPMMVEDVRVDYYGTLTPLNQLGKIACPEPRVILITPFEKGMLKDIEKAIFAASLGLTPNNDGSSIRINIPELTGERRKELAKVVKQKAEEKKVAIRNIRRDANDELKKQQAEMSQDEVKGHQDKIQKITDSYIAKLGELEKEKEKEITTL
ncbi:ribosome recycling factor [Leptospira terpstrae]|uniref:Ribosome-recycling factor n=1 Tax=Leptospira terpstrae serovar Hualin str. LT 11-33 = ATCC 700639 TaxID=1257025 RepID=N1VLG8_9LEPT|nr:ribosome recycling factor [Leptospira terpstrae]EMY60569.1 ribosome recycling factor [Leptospira terpstrae serovar Hualin str. LT 11-33 = ATCC 700639]